MVTTEQAADRLAGIVLAGPLTLPQTTRRIRQALGRCPRWLSPVLKNLVLELGEGTRPRRAKVARLFRNAPALGQAVFEGKLRFIGPIPAPEMCPASGPPTTWNLPSICTMGDLAQWLNVSVGELEWFADLHRLNARAIPPRLDHYRYRWVLKKNGSARLVECPKLRLKLLQRRILSELLEIIPPHDAVHGFRRGRSIRTFVESHVGQTTVLRFDLRDFFPSVTRARVTALFLTTGYPEPVAQRLAGICTTSVPQSVLASCPEQLAPDRVWHRNQRYRRPHLPQGAPSSPALANLAAYRLDCRLAGLATAAEANYTRYADDLVFSGGLNFSRGVERFAVRVGAIALEEGFELNHRKTRLMRQGVSQRAVGIVLNQHPNIPRRDFDALKATLHNCIRYGPDTQNHTARGDFLNYLLGRIAHVKLVNPRRGARLRALFDQIDLA